MSLKSQRKGRAAEFEVADIFNAHGFDAVVNGIYEKLDVKVAIDGRDWDCEVKRKAKCAKDVYDAIDNGARLFLERADYKPWLVTMRLIDLLYLSATHKEASTAAPSETNLTSTSVLGTETGGTTIDAECEKCGGSGYVYEAFSFRPHPCPKCTA